MASQAAKLRRTIYLSQLDLDSIFAPISAEAHDLIIRHSPTGVPTPLTKAIVMPVLERMLAEAEPGIAGVIVARSGAAERLAEEAFGGR